MPFITFATKRKSAFSNYVETKQLQWKEEFKEIEDIEKASFY